MTNYKPDKKIRHYPGQNNTKDFRLIHDQGRVMSDFRKQFTAAGSYPVAATEDCEKLKARAKSND
jgi:hypothetical protein